MNPTNIEPITEADLARYAVASKQPYCACRFTDPVPDRIGFAVMGDLIWSTRCAAHAHFVNPIEAERDKLARELAAARAAIKVAREALCEADDDIREHVQVARYNLTGEMSTGDKVAIPNPPLLIHSAGIEMSEKRRAKISAALAQLNTHTHE